MPNGKINICIACEKSCGLCSWSANLKPVTGWTATPLQKRTHNGQTVKGYHITACPQYEPTLKSAQKSLWTEGEIAALKELVRQRVRYKTIADILGRSLVSVTAKMAKLRKEKGGEYYARRLHKNDGGN